MTENPLARNLSLVEFLDPKQLIHGVAAMLTLLVVLTLVGAFGGFLAGLLGIGGGLVFVPALYFTLTEMSMPEPMLHAVATSLAAATLTGLSSARSHAMAGRVNWDSVVRIAPTVAVGALIGAWLVGGVLDSEQLQGVVAALLLLAAGLLLTQKRRRQDTPQPTTNARRLLEITSALPIGVASAVMGIAGGTWLVPMQTAIGIPIHRAVATAAVTGVLLATVAVGFMMVSTGGAIIQWSALAPLCITSMLCAPLGAQLAHRLPAQSLQRLFGCFLALLSLLIIGEI